jgi:AraC-like DNA-binding protein
MSVIYSISTPYSISTNATYNAIISYHAHLHYEIYYFHHGKANYLINDRVYTLEPGDLLLMHGMTLHKAHNDPKVEYKRTIIHFDPHYFSQLIQPGFAGNLLEPFLKLRNIRLQLKGSDKDEMEQTLARLEELYKQGTPYAHQRFQAGLLDLLLVIGELCQNPLKDIPSFPSSKEQHTQAIISILEARFKEDINLDMLQDSLHLSKYYLAKTFKEVTGMTIFHYLMHRRIYEAKLMLLQQNASITDIGYEVGFKHPSHFSRSFKSHTGLTAEHYRKQHQINGHG